MKAPLSWIREYVPVKLSLKDLTQRLTEVGVGVEAVDKNEDDTILDLEITPNRPDLLSITGIAREIAVIQKTKIVLPKFKEPKKPKKSLPITIKNDYTLSERFTGIVIDNVTIKDSPLWLSERLVRAGLRSINNIVDITNYVMLELGNPLHAFDYDEIVGHEIRVTESAGGESFTSVDNLSYTLPKGAIIIKDKERIIDLCGIKGGANSGIKQTTKRIFLRVPVDDGKRIRRASVSLGLRSEASSIFEKGVNKGGSLHALYRAVELISDLAGGEVASEVFDLKRKQFENWDVEMSLTRLNKLTGVMFEPKRVSEILTLLELSPKIKDDTVTVSVPTFRNDLQDEVDIIEEVARVYGYNKFPKTLPAGATPITPIPYKKDFDQELVIKQLLSRLGLSEINTYSLISSSDIKKFNTQKEIIGVRNPVSKEFDVMRSTLLVNLLKGLSEDIKIAHSQNYTKKEKHIGLFELGKVYFRESTHAKEERMLAGTYFPADYFILKGILEVFFEQLGIPVSFEITKAHLPFHSQKIASITVGKEVLGTLGEVDPQIISAFALPKGVSIFEIDFEKLLSHLAENKKLNSVPKYPPILEDFSLRIPKQVLVGELIKEMKHVDPIIKQVELLDIFNDSKTFRIVFQDLSKNLTNAEVATVRGKLLTHLKQKFGAEQK